MTEDDELIEKLNYGFLLGAGCSKEAGIPDMREFLNEFMQYIGETDPTLHEFIDDILKEISDEETPDLEDLMVSLDTIAGNLPYSRIIQNFRPLKSKYEKMDETANKAIALLEEYISNTTFVNDSSDLYFLGGLINLIRDLQYNPPIFTVNYDTILEFAFEHLGIPYTDGFDPYWDPDIFIDQSQMHIYKLHGSCTWYSSGSSYIRLPIKPTGSSIEVLGLGKTHSMVLYPSFSKNRMSEPLSVLLGLFRKSLGNLHALFIVGYSCRDEDIALVIAEALRVNPTLRIFVVSPNPSKGISNLISYDKRIGDACIGISTTWSLLLANNRIGRIIEDFAKGIQDYNDIIINLRYGDSYQNYNFYRESKHLLRSFQYDKLLEIYSVIRGDETSDMTLKIDAQRDSYAFVMSSLGLLYEALLMDRSEKVSQYARSILEFFDATAEKEDRGRMFEALIDEIPNELDSENWVYGENFSRINEILGNGLKEWANWVLPFIHADNLKKTLIPLTRSIIIYHNDHDFLRNFRSYLNNKAHRGSYEDHMKTIESLFPGISQRIDIPFGIDEILLIDIGDSENRNRKIIDDNPWLNTIYCDMVDQINAILFILGELSKGIY